MGWDTAHITGCGPTEIPPRKLTCWVIIDSSNAIKKVFDSETEAKRAVFPPYLVKEVEFSVAYELDQISYKLSPVQQYLLGVFKADAIVDHIIGKERLK